MNEPNRLLTRFLAREVFFSYSPLLRNRTDMLLNFSNNRLHIQITAPEMISQRSAVINLYKTLLFLGRDYPLGYEFFRTRCHRAFLKNSKETDPAKIDKMIKHGEYVVKELEAMYMLKKYRTLKARYYSQEDNAKLDEIMRRINERAYV